MPFTFPEDTNVKAGAVHETEDGTDFYVPSREQGSQTFKGALAMVATVGTPVQLPNYPCREVTLIGLDTNMGAIYVGGSDVSGVTPVYGVKLQARDSITLKVSNTNLIYIDADNGGEGISYVAI